ncbi:MAG: metallophosphoesterase family protein [Acidobacteriaceae bacterium]
MRIGIISDTHGLLRPEAIAALEDVDHILHAGDVGDIAILDRLRQIAPVTAIRGNVDRYGAIAGLPETEMVELGGKFFYLVHDVHDLDLRPEAAGIAAVISGHSHQPKIEWKHEVLYFNPGSSGPRRFSLPISIGLIDIRQNKLQAEILELTSR